jgi:hypothetical protein
MALFKLAKQKVSQEAYDKTRDDRDSRRTRLKESTDVEHLHKQLLTTWERIEESRVALVEKKVDEGIARSLLSVVEAELERVFDSARRPVRRLRQKISRLDIRIHDLSGDVVCATEEDDRNGGDQGDIENQSFDDDKDVERII